MKSLSEQWQRREEERTKERRRRRRVSARCWKRRLRNCRYIPGSHL